MVQGDITAHYLAELSRSAKRRVRDWESIAELVSVLPGFQPLMVSRFREFGSSGPITIQQTAIASRWPADTAWSEPFKPSDATPPRGFSFAAIRRSKTMLLVYSVHFKSNRGELQADIAKREEAARQLLAHAVDKERLYSKDAKVVTIIVGDFNTDPTDPRFASEQTFAILREKFLWAWEDIPIFERVTLPAKGRYPDASFDGFFVRDAQALSCKAVQIDGVSDRFPTVLTVRLE